MAEIVERSGRIRKVLEEIERCHPRLLNLIVAGGLEGLETNLDRLEGEANAVSRLVSQPNQSKTP